MKIRIKTVWLHFLALLFVVSVAHAQEAQPAQSNFSQPELEQMLAPIALYPDALLSQILMASTYPTEVVEASYWAKANPDLKGEAAVQGAQDQQWDISVKSLLPFPQVLGTMEAKIDWVTNLGNAFLGQEQQVMDTIQLLRQKAMAAGYLKSDNRVRVAQEDRLISINLVQPTAVYVPYYNPTVVYGSWSAPQYAPVYWDPWPGYAVAPNYYGWAWAPVATVVTVGVLYGAFNWRNRHIYYEPRVSYWQRHYHYDHYRYRGTNTRWDHDPRHRRDIAYRDARVDRRFGTTARTYNTRVGSRPGLNDIRGGHYKPPTVSRTGMAGRTVRTTSNPYAGFKPSGTTVGRTGAGVVGATGRTGAGVVGTTGRTGAGVVGTTGRTGSVPSGAQRTKSVSNRGSNPPGVAHGVRGTQPSASTRIPNAGARTGNVGRPTGATDTTRRTGGRTGSVPSGAQGTKSVSNRGSNPPGVAHGVRGTQPSASTRIPNAGARTGNVGKPTSSNVRSNTGGTKPAAATPRTPAPKPATSRPSVHPAKKKPGEQ